MTISASGGVLCAAWEPDTHVPAEAGSPLSETRLLWSARRNCALTPRQLGHALAVLSLPCVLVAAGFWLQGVRWIAPFAGLELAAVGWAAWVYARHAVDREAVLLRGGTIVVEHCCGSQVERIELPAGAVRVDVPSAPGMLVRLRARSSMARVGRYIRPERRAALAEELRASVARAGGGGAIACAGALQYRE